jgi:signal transduction histidine kinase
MLEVKGGRILVVDRDAPARTARARILRDAGHTVFDAGYFSDPALLRRTKPELLVLDADLQVNPGSEIGHVLEQEFQDATVLRISTKSRGSSGDSNADGLYADTFLVEPVPSDVLVSTANALLRLGRAERALRDSIAQGQTARDEADEANRIKDDFLGTLSHELRTPLHAIVGWVALLRSRPFDEDTRAKALEVIDRNARVQTALIEDLLDVSRITLGQLRLTWRAVELAPILFSALDAIKPTAEINQVTISTDIALDPDIKVRADAVRLRQVFWNLLTNAVKFTPAGGRVDVRAHATGGRAEIEVTDTGRGISPELMPHMFERFGRGDTGTTSRDRGLGLGLAIARELIELHGGTLTAASPGVDQGATFVITLPFLADRPETAGRATARAGASGQRGSTRLW